MLDNVFAVGDVHGCLPRLQELLKNWNPDNQQLVLLGDLIDRGENSLGVIMKCMELEEKDGAKIVGGNHEEIFLQWLDNPEEDYTYYLKVGGFNTIRSFVSYKEIESLPSLEKIAQLIKDRCTEEMMFMQKLPHYYEQGQYVFVHAGVNLLGTDWRKTAPHDFRWIREPFHEAQNKTGKIFIFGHTPTHRLNADRNCGPWFSPCRTKFGIDGGAVFGGLLLGLLIKEDCYEVYAA